MEGTLLAIFALGAGLWMWSTARRKHEQALRAVRRALQGSGAQLLDDTVALAQLRLTRTQARLALAHTYSFDVTIDGFNREQGTMTLIGPHVEIIDLPWLRELH